MFGFKYPYGLQRKQSAKIAQKGTGNSGEWSTKFGYSFAIPSQIASPAFQPKNVASSTQTGMSHHWWRYIGPIAL